MRVGVLLGVLPGDVLEEIHGKKSCWGSWGTEALVTPALQTLVPPRTRPFRPLQALRSDKAFKGLMRPFKDFERAVGLLRAL